MTRLGDLLQFGLLFKASGSNDFAQIAHVLGNFCEGVKIFHFPSGIIFGQLPKTFGDFLLGTLTPIKDNDYLKRSSSLGAEWYRTRLWTSVRCALGWAFLLRPLFANKLQFANMCEKVLKITETRINHVFKAIIIPKCCWSFCSSSNIENSDIFALFQLTKLIQV